LKNYDKYPEICHCEFPFFGNEAILRGDGLILLGLLLPARGGIAMTGVVGNDRFFIFYLRLRVFAWGKKFYREGHEEARRKKIVFLSVFHLCKSVAENFSAGSGLILVGLLRRCAPRNDRGSGQ